MFCPTCGKSLPDEALFCDECGTPFPVQEPSVPEKPSTTPASAAFASTPPFFAKCLETFKNFFSKKTLSYLPAAAADSSLSWTLLGGVSILLFALSLPTFISRCGLTGSWGTFFLFSLLGGILSFGAAFGILWLASKFLWKQPKPLFAILNTVAYISLPLAIAYLCNLLLSLLWVWLAVPMFIIGAIFSSLLLYKTVRLWSNASSDDYLGFVLVASCMVVFILLFTGLMLRSALSVYLRDLLGALSFSGIFS